MTLTVQFYNLTVIVWTWLLNIGIIWGPYSLALQQILDKMRTTPLKGRFVILIKKPFKEFQLAQLSGIRGRNPEIVKGVIYKSIAEAEWDIFKRRWFFLTGIKVTVEDPKL